MFRVDIIELYLEEGKIKSKLTLEGCTGIDKLRNHIEAPQGPRYRILLVEARSQLNVGSDASPLEKLLIDEIKVDTDFFREHHTLGPKFTSDEDNIEIFQLPTALAPEDRWHIDFFELYTWHCKDAVKTVALLNEGEGVPMPSGKTRYRKVQAHKWKTDEKGWLLVAPRKCSYWSREKFNGDGKGWDGRLH